MADDPNLAAYLEAKKYVQQSLTTSAEQYDKAVLALAGGAFGVSIAFIKDIAPNFYAGTGCWLVLAWVAFIVSMGATLCSFQTSTYASYAYDRFIDERRLHADKPPRPLKRWWNTSTKWLNGISLVSFLIGAILLAAFAYQNLEPKGNKMGEKKPAVPANIQTTQGHQDLVRGAIVANPPIIQAVPVTDGLVNAGAIVAGPPVLSPVAPPAGQAPAGQAPAGPEAPQKK